MFPHEGKLVTIDQLSYTRKGRMETSYSNVPLIDQVSLANEILGVGMYTSLMGTFDMPTPINYLGTTRVGKNICTVVDRTDPWVLCSQEECNVPLSAAEVSYQYIFDATVDSILTPSVFKESDEA